MKILFVSSEVAPFAKVGGLGDVAAALPRYLRAKGHDVRVVVPMYARVHKEGRVFEEVIPELAFDMGPHRVHVSIFAANLPGSDLPVYFVRCPALYDRPSIYSAGGDEHLRFSVLSWAALVLCQHLGFGPDILHVNDWQTSLIPLLLRTAFKWDRLFARTRTVLTIHNIGHQGSFDAKVLGDTGIASSAHLFHQDDLRAGRVNFLLTGILHANAITTVSPGYAREIQTDEQGVGLAPYLRNRKDVLFGVLNGIDETEWNPATDTHLPANFSADDLSGKELCKASLLASAGLPYARETLTFGLVSRLVWQKGIDLCVSVLPRLLRQTKVNLVVLGTGEPRYEDFFRRLARSFPRQVVYQSAFSERLAHRIEAGADAFLMPSRYEPCGLNQMYSLCYGTPPIVHRTGGLADSVWPFDVQTGKGTGVVFDHWDDEGFSWALRRALELWGTGAGRDRARWQRMQQNGMRLPLGWRHRVGEYEDLYRKVAPHA
ncbi:MAG: glycogen/starch synthase [Polyangiaceae bacterium]